MIVVVPAGGLANRMRFLESALTLSEDVGEELHVLWLMNGDLNCRFDALFRVPEGVAKIHHLSTMRIAGKVFHRVLRQVLSASCDVRLVDGSHARLARDGVELKSLVAGRRVQISGSMAFHGTMAGFDRFVPIDSLREIIDSHVRPSEKLVGVHVRRSDGEWPIRFSPTHAFVSMMECEVRDDASTEFFVASDSVDEIAHLSRLFPGRIRSYRTSSYRRTKPEAIQDALVDLYCLASCRKVIGSFGSSFSDVAAHIGGIPIDRPRVLSSALEEFSGRIEPPDLESDTRLFEAVRRVRWAGGTFCPVCGGDQWIPLASDSSASPRRYLCMPMAPDEALIYRLDIQNNTISQLPFGSGLSVFNDGTGEASMLIQGNSIDLPLSNGVPGAVLVGNNLCLDVRDNTFTGSAYSPLQFFEVEQFPGPLNIAGLGTSTTDPTVLSTFFGTQNPGVPAFDVVLDALGATAVAAGTCGM